MENKLILPLKLDSGQVIKIEATSTDKEQEIGVLDAIPIEKIADMIKDIGKSFKGVFEAVGPKRVGIKLGLEVSLESGALTALIVKGTGKANFEVSLEWEK